MDATAVEWREKNKSRYREWRKNHYQKIRETQIAKATEWNKNNSAKKAEKAATWYRKMRHEVIMAYGGYKCNCPGCDETEPLFLVIDHVNNDGHKYRKTKNGYKVGEHTGGKLLSWIKKHNFPEGFQVLCASCNQGKALNNGICPHLTRRRNDHPERE